jgi:hypothetical protein
LPELLDGYGRDVDSQQIESARYKGQVVATVAAPDIDAIPETKRASSGKNVIDKRDRLF